MGLVAVTSVLDEETAEMFAKELSDAGIPAEVRRFGINPYLGAATPASFEVRVSEERLDEARAFLDRRGAGPGREAEAPERPRRLWMLLGASVIIPVPVACLYARWSRLGYLLLAAGLTGLVAGLGGGAESGLYTAAGAKAIDLTLGPILLAIENRRREAASPRALVPGATLSALLFAACVGAALLWHWQAERRRLSDQSTALFQKAVERVVAGSSASEDPDRPIRFPDVPVGKVHALVLTWVEENRARASRVLDDYEREARRWDAADEFRSAGWRDDRAAAARQARRLVIEQRDAWDRLNEQVQPFVRGDDSYARAFFESVERTRARNASTDDEQKLLGLLIQQWDVWEELAQLPSTNPTEQPSATRLVERSRELRTEINTVLTALGRDR